MNVRRPSLTQRSLGLLSQQLFQFWDVRELLISGAGAACVGRWAPELRTEAPGGRNHASTSSHHAPWLITESRGNHPGGDPLLKGEKWTLLAVKHTLRYQHRIMFGFPPPPPMFLAPQYIPLLFFQVEKYGNPYNVKLRKSGRLYVQRILNLFGTLIPKFFSAFHSIFTQPNRSI